MLGYELTLFVVFGVPLFTVEPDTQASVQAVVDSLETSGWINVGYTQSKIGMSRFSKK